MSDAQTPEPARRRGRPSNADRAAREPVREVAREPVREAHLDGNGRAVAYGRDNAPLSRKRGGNVDRFHIPDEIKPQGWTYEWKTETVAGQVDVAHQMHMAENGWRAVPANRHPGLFMPAGYEGAIKRDGMVLMERPAALTKEARDEETMAARAQMQGQQAALGLAIPSGFEARAFDRGGAKGRAIPFEQGIRQQVQRADVDRPRLQIAE